MEGSPLTENIKSEMRILERTVEILGVIEKEQPIGINKLSERFDLPEHKVRYSLRMLEEESLIEPTPKGAITTGEPVEFRDRVKKLLDELKDTSLKLQNELSH